MSINIDFRIYVASLTDYNNGILHGTWLAFVDYTDINEVYEAINLMLEGSPTTKKWPDISAEEWAIHDYEGWAGIEFSENESIKDLWEVYENLQGLENNESEAFSIYYGNMSASENIDENTLDNFRAAYQGEFDSDADFAEYLLEETGGLDAIPENLRYYFDYEKYARDLFMGGDYWTHEGHVFSNY